MHQENKDLSPVSTTRVVAAPLLRSQGAEVNDAGVCYRTWCKHDRVAAVILDDKGKPLRTIPLSPKGSDYHSGIDKAGAPGDLYKYRFNDGDLWPDPASRYQPFGVHGPSQVIDPGGYRWTDGAWSPPVFSELIIYELHVGAFTVEGTFRAARERLKHVAALGATAVELMPVADFPGERNWGYDGVMLYAPARIYGTPDDLRALVDAAHALGLAVILDVVYNHFGPDGNFTGVYHDRYHHPKDETPWGTSLNYRDAPVRAFFVQNAPYWMREFHIDGFRLDATHAIQDNSERHILAEIANEVHALRGFVIAEDDRNAPCLVTSADRGGLGFDGVWADDFHHIVRVLLTNERESYYANFAGNSRELAQTLTHGWFFRGQKQAINGEARGGDPAALAPEQFVYCISNHDQVGNRAFGERVNHVTSAAAYRAASALLCLVPQTPMLFMGQEWAASTPFQFFTDHNAELGKALTEGRRNEFIKFAAFRDSDLLEIIPNPQAADTFLRSKLRWDELAKAPHAGMLLLYRDFLRLRRTHLANRSRSRDDYAVIELAGGIVALLLGRAGAFDFLVLTDLTGNFVPPNLDDGRLAPGGGKDWRELLSSNEMRFGGGGSEPFSIPTIIAYEAV